MKSSYRLTGAINRSEDRRELPTIPQPTHTIEWLARTNFKHRPLRRHDIPKPRKHKVPKRQVQTDDLNKSFYVYWKEGTFGIAKTFRKELENTVSKHDSCNFCDYDY